MSKHDLRTLQSTVNLGDQRETPLFPYGYGLSLGDEDTLGEDLSEEDEAEVVLEKGEVVVFDRTPQGPYGLYLGDPLNWRLPVRSTLMESAAGALSLRTVDVRRQEDARRARWNGRAPAQLYFQTPTPHDFKALGELGGVLTVTLLIHEAPTAPVFLRMDGTYPRAGALDVTETLGAQQLDQEVVLSWPLQAWADAVLHDGPTCLVLSRQNIPVTTDGEAVCTGAGIVRSADAPQVVLVGTGSEVAVCLEAAELLAADGVATQVVSMPSWDRFEEQDADFQASIFPMGVPVLSVEAGVTMGWSRYASASVGIDRFGASAPGGTVMAELGINAANVAAQAKNLF